MKDLLSLVKECMAELDAVGIRYGTVRSFTVNTRAKSRWGQCRRVANGVFEINISERLLRDDVPDAAAKETVIHELLHTAEDCSGHTGRWKQLADRVNACYPQYHIKRTNSFEEKGIAADIGTAQSRAPKYKIVCNKCGYFTYRKKASSIVLHPSRYRCGRCGGRIQVFEIEKSL